MHKQEILQQSLQSGKPVILEFWAPWCVPCKVMAPALEKTAGQYADTVELIRINADDHPQAVKDFGILGIPAIVVIQHGREVSRHIGALDATQLEILFAGASNQVDILIPPTGSQRVLRIGSGLAVALMGFIWGPPTPFYMLGAGIIFSGLYDRCPIFKMLYPRLKSLLNPRVSTPV